MQPVQQRQVPYMNWRKNDRLFKGEIHSRVQEGYKKLMDIVYMRIFKYYEIDSNAVTVA